MEAERAASIVHTPDTVKRAQSIGKFLPQFAPGVRRRAACRKIADAGEKKPRSGRIGAKEDIPYWGEACQSCHSASRGVAGDAAGGYAALSSRSQGIESVTICFRSYLRHDRQRPDLQLGAMIAP